MTIASVILGYLLAGVITMRIIVRYAFAPGEKVDDTDRGVAFGMAVLWPLSFLLFIGVNIYDWVTDFIFAGHHKRSKGATRPRRGQRRR